MRWSNTTPDLCVADLQQGLRHLDIVSILSIVANLSNGANLYISQNCQKTVIKHVNSDTKEVGGLLLGQVLQASVIQSNKNIHIIEITDALPSLKMKNSQVSLCMDNEVWIRASEYLDQGKIIVGWYHSHPHSGAFFSDTDRKTQRAFFYHNYSIGWVIDPYNNQQKIFLGSDSKEYPHQLLETPDSFL